MDEATKYLVGQGIMGVMLLVCFLAIVYLQKKRDGDTDARIKENRESLLSIAEINAILRTVKDAMATLSQSDAGLTANVMTAMAEIKIILTKMESRQGEIAEIAKSTNEMLRAIESKMQTLLDRTAGGPR